MKPATDVCCCGCGRVYDAGLFDLGRSFQCACGATVRPPLVERPGLADRPPRFMADAMLGRLARWLRLLGFDTAWEADIDDADLVRRAADERRIVLTRDRILVREWRVRGIHLVDAETPMAQLIELDRVFALGAFAAPFTRCAHCNVALEPITPADARGHVPSRVADEHDDLRRCPRCRRIFWPGSHVARIRRALRTAGLTLSPTS